MDDFEQTMAIGVVFDISDKSYYQGQRFLSLIKDNLIKFATQLGLNCGILVSHPENEEVPRRQGESVSAIAKYVEWQGFDIELAIKHVLNLIGHQNDSSKFILVFTDRYNEMLKYRYEKSTIMNQAKRLDCKFIFFDFSGKCPRFDHAEVIQLDTPIFDIGNYVNGKSI